MDALSLWILLNLRNCSGFSLKYQEDLTIGFGLLNTFIAHMDVFDSKKLFRILAEVSRGAYNWIGRALHQ
jgi:hypothetical protein